MARRHFGLLLLWTLMIFGASAGQAADLEQLLQRYARESERPFDAQAGAANWIREQAPKSGAQPRSCASCHGNSLTSEGRHVRTRKLIEPLAPSVNPKRLIDTVEIEKWFLRNCKWTWGRECTAQEKGDFLRFISSK